MRSEVFEQMVRERCEHARATTGSVNEEAIRRDCAERTHKFDVDRGEKKVASAPRVPKGMSTTQTLSEQEMKDMPAKHTTVFNAKGDRFDYDEDVKVDNKFKVSNVAAKKDVA